LSSTNHYNFAFLDEGSKREIRRSALKAVAIPGYQVPFGSRELPIGRGWGTGGIQLTLSLIGPDDVLKVIDQGSDESVNAVNIKKFVGICTDVETTEDPREATLIQTRHRIPEMKLADGQILIFQVPIPEPLRIVEPREEVTKKMHAERDYAPIWLQLYESLIKHKKVTIASEFPTMVAGRYLMNPSPIPKFDNPKLHQAECLYLFGAGREKKIYAIPPFTEVESLAFDDVPFEVESFEGRGCRICGSTDTYLDEVFDQATGAKYHQCSDSFNCDHVQKATQAGVGEDDLVKEAAPTEGSVASRVAAEADSAKVARAEKDRATLELAVEGDCCES